MRLFGRLLSPALTNVRVHWDGLDVTQAPSEVPPVFAGGRLLVYGFLRGDASAATVRFTADAPSGPLALAVRLDPARAVPGVTVATLAARARIRELEESPGLTTARGSRQSGRKAEALVREIVDLGRELAHALGIELRQLTSLISQVSGDRDEVRAVWATALALAWLARHAADAEDQWRLLARKAQAWLDGVSAARPGGAPWRDAAEAVVKTSSSTGG